MKKTLMVILIITLLLLASFVSVSSSVTKTAIEKIDKQKLQYDNQLKIDYSYVYEDKDVKTPVEDPETAPLGQPDFIISHFLGWYSPFPTEDEGIYEYYVCFKWRVDNIGSRYVGTGIFEVWVEVFYPDGEVRKIQCSYSEDHDDIWHKGFVDEGGFAGGAPSGRPTRFRTEIITDLPDSNTENNAKIVECIDGVTIWGQVFEKDENGEKKLVDRADIWCDDEYPDYDYTLNTYQDGPHNFFTIWVPKKPDAPPFEYTVKTMVDLDLRKIKIQKTEPLNGLNFVEMYFTFGSKGKIRSHIFFDFLGQFPSLERFFSHPIFKSLLNL